LGLALIVTVAGCGVGMFTDGEAENDMSGECEDANQNGLAEFVNCDDGSPAPLSHPVEPAWLDSLAGLPIDALIEEVAGEVGVNGDLLRAIGAVESGFAPVHPQPGEMLPGSGWYGLSPDDVLEASQRTGLAEHRISTERIADTVAAAVLLAIRHEQPLSAEVGRVLQRGYIGATADLNDLDEPDVVVLPPWTIEELHSVLVEDELALNGGNGDYPGAVRFLPSANVAPRTDEVERIILVSTEASYTQSIEWLTEASSEQSVHYVISRLDGEVTQLVPEASSALSPNGGADNTIVIGLAAPRAGFASWTPQAMESSARLVSYLSQRYSLPLDLEHVVTRDVVAQQPSGDDLGSYFPWESWLDSALCFAAGGAADCPITSGQPEYPPPDDSASGARSHSEARDVAGVPYFYQYENGYNPSGSCQNTSVAMVLKWLGWSGTPDTISARFGTSLAQSPAGLAQVFNTLAEEAGLTARVTPHMNGSLDGMRSLLAEGKPVIVHSYQTGYGHVLVTTGYNGSHYTVNDPAGRWVETWKGGYPYGWNNTIGRGIRYAKAPFEQSIATSNGSSYMPLWYYELTGVSAELEPPPIPDAPVPEPEPEPEPDGPSPDSLPANTWASIELLAPLDGETVGDPLVLRARREGGHSMEFWAGSYRLTSPLIENPADALVDIWTLGERRITVRNLSQWGTVLATDSALVTIRDTFALTPQSTSMGDLVYQFGATPEFGGIAYVEYRIDGELIEDELSQQSRATGEGFLLRHEFGEPGSNLLLGARGYDATGQLLAEGIQFITVFGEAEAPQCLIVGALECGRIATGDTSQWGEYSDVLNGYPGVVGNYEGNEAGWTWQATTSSTVRVSLLAPSPTEVNLDVMLLRQQGGVCSPADVIGRVFVWLEFEAVAGANYTFVVDGYSGDAGAYELELDCDPD